MQEFTCPQCGRTSRYDPWTGSAQCDHCGYTPPERMRIRAHRPKKATGTHQVYLNDIVALWNGTYQSDPHFGPETRQMALAFFRDYRWAMGEDPGASVGDHMRYLRSYEPKEHEVLIFVGAYTRLKRGDRTTAASELGALTLSCPDFVDPWIWLAAVADDPARREECLQNALALEPANPLAQDAMAILRGRVKPVEKRSGIRRLQHKVETSKCPQCGGALRYEAGTAQVTCPYCKHQVQLQQAKILEEEATPVGDLQLKRRYQGFRWMEVQRIIHCQACGAEMSMTRHLAQSCPFCGSAQILVRDNHETFERPNGFAPFALNASQAAEAVQRAQHSGVRGLKTWLTGEEQQVKGLQAIYLPFWVFDGFVEVRTWAEQTSPLRAHLTIPPRSDMMVFDNLFFSGMDSPLSDMLHKLVSAEVEGLVPYEPRLLADWPAALYVLDVEVVVEKAYDKMIAMARHRAGLLVASSSDSSQPVRLKRSFQVSSTTYQLVLLPIWVALLKQEKKNSLALVNGQTGKIVFGLQLAAD